MLRNSSYTEERSTFENPVRYKDTRFYFKISGFSEREDARSEYDIDGLKIGLDEPIIGCGNALVGGLGRNDRREYLV